MPTAAGTPNITFKNILKAHADLDVLIRQAQEESIASKKTLNAQQAKIIELNQQIEFANLEIKKLRGGPPLIKSAFEPPTCVIKGVEYVTKEGYEATIRDLRGGIMLEGGPNNRTENKGTLVRKLEVEISKVAAFEQKLDNLTKLLEVTLETIATVRYRNRHSKKAFAQKLQKRKNTEIQSHQTGDSSSSALDCGLTLDDWPDIDGPLSNLAKHIRRNNIIRTRGQSVAPLASETANHVSNKTLSARPGKLYLADKLHDRPSPSESLDLDADITSDEESPEEQESNLFKFSPTSKALLRRPGSETLAALHYGFEAGVDNTPAVIHATTGPVNVKAEPGSEGDWYGKFGYSRITDEQETLDLNNIRGRGHSAELARGHGQIITTPERDSIRDSLRLSQTQNSRTWTSQLDLDNINRSSNTGCSVKRGLNAEVSSSKSLIEGGETLEKSSWPRSNDDAKEDHAQSESQEEGPVVKMPSTTGKSKATQPKIQKYRDPLTEIPQPNHSTKIGGVPESPTHDIKAYVKRETGCPATPLPEKRKLREPQGSSHQKKPRIKSVPTSTITGGLVDNPFSPSKFRINKDKNNGLGYAFDETVRGKSGKNCRSVCVKACCKGLASGKFHEMWQPPEISKGPKFSTTDWSQPEDREEQLLLERNKDYRAWQEQQSKGAKDLVYVKHRVQHKRAPEVTGFWESDFPTTQQLDEQRQESERQRVVKGFERHAATKKGGLYERRPQNGT